MRLVPVLAGAALVAGLAAPALSTPAVAAETAPTPAQIVKGLTPTKGGPPTTRGIRIVNGGGAATAGARPAAASVGRPASVSLTVEFATGSAALTAQARHTLDALGKALNDPKLAGDKFRIEGHTDTVGSAAGNLALSQHRAERVAQYLEDRFSIPAARLTPVGMGEQGLAVATPPQTPNAANRRVVVVNLGG